MNDPRHLSLCPEPEPHGLCVCAISAPTWGECANCRRLVHPAYQRGVLKLAASIADTGKRDGATS